MGYSAFGIATKANRTGHYRADDVSFMMTGVWEIRVRITQLGGGSRAGCCLTGAFRFRTRRSGRAQSRR